MKQYINTLLFLAITSLSCNNAHAQTGAEKTALHSYYRKVLRHETKLTRPERKLRKSMYGMWETTQDSTLPKGLFARVKLPKDSVIQKHGLHFTKKGAELYYTIGDSLKHVPWLWNIHNDTIIYGVVTKHMMGDTIVIKEQIVNRTENRIDVKTIGRDTITSAVLCTTKRPLRATTRGSRPMYQGDLRQYIENGLEDFNPDGEYYTCTLEFMVNCKGEVLKVYGYPASHDDFEQRIAKLIRSSKWAPAIINHETVDAEVYMEVIWKKGFVDVGLLDRNY